MAAHTMTAGSARLQARLCGIAYLYIVFAGLFAEAFVRSTLIDFGDAAATARNILASETLYRWGVVVEAMMHVADMVVAALLYRLLKPVNRELSLLAALLRLAVMAFAAIRTVLLLVPLALLKTPSPSASFDAGQIDTLALLALRLHGSAYGVSLIFFGLCCLAVGYLIFRSGYFPRMIGLLMAIAGLCYLVHSLSSLLAPAVASLMFPYILLPCLIAELALATWLTVVGINITAWTDRVEASVRRA